MTPTIDAAGDARWAAWQERGRLNDGRTRARMRIVLPAIALMVIAAIYTLVLR
jgi:hypothetical protein